MNHKISNPHTYLILFAIVALVFIAQGDFLLIPTIYLNLNGF
jgi:hypothetical protein